jgi:hypothetical protein
MERGNVETVEILYTIKSKSRRADVGKGVVILEERLRMM